MSVHRDCGEEIKWVRRGDDLDRWAPPMERAGFAFIIDEREVAIEVPVYKRHVCDPEKVAAWLDYQERMAALDHKRPKDQQGRQNLQDLARNRERLAQKELAEKRKCPRCEAKRGDPCMNLTERRKGNLDVVTLWPHPERIALAT